MDAIKQYLSDSILTQIEGDRAGWFKDVKASVDTPLPVPEPVGLLGRVANVFV
jgi:hypothetical protein